MWRRILALVRKEFLALLQDKKSRVVIVVPPILQVLVFGYAATFDLNHVPFAIYNEDRGDISRELLARFAASPSFHAVARITRDAEIAPLLDRKEVLLVLHIGPRFSSDARRGRVAPLQAIVDGRNSNTAMLTLNYVSQIVVQFSEDWAAREGRPLPPARLQARAWFNPNLESQWFFVPGIVGLLTLVVTMLVTALSVAREREQGTFDQLLVTPLRPGEILLGKALPGLLIGLFEATAIVLVATLWFRVPLLGHLWTLYAGLVLFLLSAIGVGLMISSLAVTQQQGLLGAFLFLVPSIILSGFATPIANMPPAVQYLTYLNPMRYFLIVLRSVFLQGTPFHLLLPQFWPLLAIAAVALSIAGWLFRHRMY
jgi:drug efflux transport system permease protein